MIVVAPPGRAQVGAAKPEILVLGSPHLRGIGATEPRINIAGVLQAIRPFAPDAVVVEWLHPSIDPANTFNYPSRGDSLVRAIADLGRGSA